MKNAIKFVLRYFIVVLSLMVSFSCRLASATEVVGDDQEATNVALSKNPAPELTQADLDGASSTVSLFGLKEDNRVETYYYSAYGDLSTYSSGEDITLYFEVTDFFTEVKSARIVLNAYDVDYPSATEADITYLNGSSLGWRLQGGNEEWNVNNIPIKNLNLLKTPATVNETARNIFFVDVDATNEGWVTCISKAILVIEGEVGIKVDASDGTEPDGILIEWTEVPNAIYSLWRNEEGTEEFEQVYCGSDASFLDKNVESLVTYNYVVNVSLGTVTLSGEDDGYYLEIMPKIEKVELPEFWLEDRAPLAITWNNFDDEKFRVGSCMVLVQGTVNRKLNIEKEKLEEMKPRARVDFDTAEETKYSDGDFGVNKIQVSWTVDKLKNGQWTSLMSEMTTETKDIKIFFNKYEGGDIQNWYKFWPKTGAITKGYIGDGGKFKYSDNPELRGCARPLKYENPIGVPPKGFPEIHKGAKYDVEYQITQYATCKKTKLKVDTNKTEIVEKGESLGLETLQLVLSHELTHGASFEPYFNLTNDYVRIGTLKKNSGYERLADLFTEIIEIGNSGKVFSDDEDEWLDALGKAWRDGKYVCDLDGDVVLDNEEAAFGFKVRNPDTYNIAKTKKSADYATYGDNECLAIMGEENPWVTIDKSKDWAFPGSQKCHEQSGDYKVKVVKVNGKDKVVAEKTPKQMWDASKAKETELETFNKFGGYPRGGSSVALKSTSSVNESQPKNATNLINSLQTGGDLVSLPMQFETEDGLLSIASELVDQTQNYAVMSGYTSLAISLSIANEGESYNDTEISAYLVDMNGAPVAFARTICDIPTGTHEVELKFPATSLRRMKTNFYRLAFVEVRNANSEFGELIFSTAQLKNNTFAYSNAQFVGLSANFLYNTFSEVKSQEQLTVNVNALVSTSGNYQIEARLENSKGECISHITKDVEFESGEVTTSFDFSGEDIYLSHVDGPYQICFVRISQNGVTIDERRVPYSTKEYKYTDFTPANVCLTIDEDSFKREADLVGDDGLISNLSFSFEVNYHREGEVTCQGRLSLYGKNDTIVAVSQETFSLVKGENTLTFQVDGSQIQRSGVNGPYYVKGVLLEPQNGAAECFTPKMAPIELNPEDFGAYPFKLTGTVSFNEYNGGYELFVPIEILRANTITLRALLVDANGQAVTTSITTKAYTGVCTDNLCLTFTEAEINASERKGPYTVRFIQIKTDIPGIAPVDIPVPETAKEITKAYTRYVDCLNESDVCDGYTWETAFRTIQEAVDIADPGDVILVADGVYEPFVTENKAISIVSLNGYTRTFIDGAGYARCATLGYEASHQDTILDGFTLFDGNASTSAVSVLWNCGGGVCCGTVLNCRVVNCIAEKGGAAYYGFLENCLLDWNEATNAGGGSYYGIRLNCTIVDNYAKNSGGGTYEGDTYNSIVWGNVRGTSSYVLENYYGGEFYFSNTTPAVSGDGNISQYPCFRDWENRDYRLALDSPCEDVGYTFSFAEAIDLLGNPRVRGDSVDMGAYETYRSYYQDGFCDFVEEEITTTEKTSVTPVSILGGREGQACSVQLNLTHNTTAAADILNVMCESADGRLETVSKFPYTVNWDVGEVEKKSIKIFIKDDALIEDDEFFTLQLANPVGMELGEFRTCTVKVYDEDAPQSLANAIQNASLKPTTKGDGKWSVENGNRSYVKDDTYDLYAISPLMTSGQQSTLSLASVTGPGTLYFSLKFVGVEEGTLPSKLVVYNGQKEVGSLTPANQDDDWGEWIVTVNEEGKQALSFKFIQGEKSSVQARITRVYWIPANSRVDRIPLILKTSPVEGGYTSGSGVYPRGEKMPLVATPRPGWEFVGWYLQSGELFDTNPKQNLYFNASASGAVTLIAQFKKTPYIRALADTPEGGKVSGSGYCTSGKKVTLKATANKGFKFKGWYATRMGSSVLFDATQCVATTPTLVIDRTAKPAATTDKSTTITDVVGDTTYFAYFEGEPRMVVSRNSDEAGKVTGAGRYAPGTKVTLKATANKGYVFAGWYKDAEFMTPCDSSSVDYRAPTYSLVMGECEQELFARFVPVAEDVVLDLTIDGKHLPVDEALQFEGEIRLGCEVESYSLPKITVAGLPTGMKFTSVPVTLKATANTPATVVPRNTIYGTPTMPGMYTVKVSLTNASIKKAIVKTFDVYVPNLTDDAIPLADSYGPFTPGVTYTVTIDGAAGCSVTGLPKGMKWTATDIVDKKTMSVTVPANAAYGVPTTPGNYTATFTKTINGVKHVATATFTVGALPKLIVDVSEYGKVTGAGAFIANKSVTLTAKANKGYVFAGWYKDAEFTTPCDSTLVDYRNPKYSYTMDVVDTRLYPRFVTVEEEANYAMDVNLFLLEEPLLFETMAYEYAVNEAVIPLTVVVDSLTLPKIFVVGLPKGMIYNSKTCVISGKPTKIGESIFLIMVQNASQTAAIMKEFPIIIYSSEGATP